MPKKVSSSTSTRLLSRIFSKVRAEFVSKSQRVWSRSKKISVRSSNMVPFDQGLIEVHPIHGLISPQEFVGEYHREIPLYPFHQLVGPIQFFKDLLLVPAFEQCIIEHNKRMDPQGLPQLHIDVIKITRGTGPRPEPDFMGVSHRKVIRELCCDQVPIGGRNIYPIVSQPGKFYRAIDQVPQLFFLLLQDLFGRGGKKRGAQGNHTVVRHRFYQISELVVVDGHILVVGGMFCELKEEHTSNGYPFVDFHQGVKIVEGVPFQAQQDRKSGRYVLEFEVSKIQQKTPYGSGKSPPGIGMGGGDVHDGGKAIIPFPLL